MKKRLAIAAVILSLLVSSVNTFSISTAAEEDDTITVDGLIYRVYPGGGCDLSGVSDTTITTVTIPAEINGEPVIVGGNVFRDCKALTEILVDENNPNLCSKDGVLFNKEATTLFAYPCAKPDADYQIPDSVTRMCDVAFNGCTELYSVTFPEGFIQESPCIILNCPNLTTVNGTIQRSGHLAVRNCKSIEYLHFGGKQMETNLGLYPKLKTVEFDDDVVVEGQLNVSNPELTTLSVPCISRFYVSEPPVRIHDCEKLETLYLRYDSMHGRVRIRNCPNLREIIILDVNTVEDSGGTLELAELPLLESIVCEAQETEIDLVTYNCGDFSLYGRNTNDRFLQKSCAENEIPFCTDGDIDGDGNISILDVVKLNKALLCGTRLTSAQEKAADVDGDGVPDFTDSLWILKYVVEIIDDFGSIS